MRRKHLLALLITVGVGIWLGRQSWIQAPIVQTLMPEPVFKSFAISGDLDDFFVNEPLLDQIVERWYGDLSPKARVGQLIMPAWDGQTDIEALTASELVGGFMLLSKSLAPTQIQNLKSKNQTSAVPWLIASDAEPSLLKYRFNAPFFTGETADLDTPEEINRVGKGISEFLQDYGVNLNFAPVYDRGVNQSVIGTRAFSTEPGDVIVRANQLSNVFKADNIIPTAKHFPGHGLVTEDTHVESATITGPLRELSQFEAAIRNKIPVIMVGHLAVESDYVNTQGLPATVSKDVMQTLLREEMQFDGIIITDAMNMAAVTKIPNAEIRALQAGADIILMPANSRALNQEILTLIETDPDFANLIEDKVKRVLRLKAVWALSESW